AGLGTRLRPLSQELPKPAWPLFDVPLAAHVLGALAAAGVTEAVVNQHHLPELLRAALEPWIPAGLRVWWSPEPEILGTGGALLPWRARLSGGPVFLANGDTYQEVDLGEMRRRHRDAGGLATLVLRRLPEGAKAPIEADARGRIVRFLAARAPGSAPGVPCEFSGIHLLEPGVLERLPARPHCINAEVHQRLVAEGALLFGYFPPEGSFWSDLGTPDRYLGAHRELLARGRLPAACPGQRVAEDREAAGGGRVLAPSYLGPGARVARGAAAGPFAVLGRGAEVTGGAVVWAGARVEADLGRAVLSASGARLEAG
ncbi:MAG: nucleotidyltransferase family protein, partial [Deferrisomatales bacterium]